MNRIKIICNKADRKIANGENKDALMLYLKAFSLYDEKWYFKFLLKFPGKFENSRNKICSTISHIYFILNEYENSLKYFFLLPEHAHNISGKKEAALSLIHLKKYDDISKKIYSQSLPLIEKEDRKYIFELFRILKSNKDKSTLSLYVAIACHDKGYNFSQEELYFISEVIKSNEFDGKYIVLAELLEDAQLDEDISEILSKYYIEKGIFTEKSFQTVKKNYDKSFKKEYLLFLGEYYSKNSIYNDHSRMVLKEIVETVKDVKPEIIRSLGECLQKFDEKDEFALSIYEKVFEHYKDNIDNSIMLAKIYSDSKRKDFMALKCYESAVFYISKDHDFMINLVMTYLSNRKFSKKALWCCERIIEQWENIPSEVYILQAYSYLSQGKKKDALMAFSKIESIERVDINDSMNKDYHILNARLKLYISDNSEILTFINRLIPFQKENPKDFDILVLLGDLYTRLIPEIRFFDCSLDEEKCLLNNDQCLPKAERGEYAKKALEYYLLAMEEKEEDSLIFKLAKAYYFCGFNSRARESIEKINIKVNHYAPVICFYSRLMLIEKNHGAAIKKLEEAVNKNIEFPNILLILLSLLWEEKRIDEGIEFSGKGIKKFQKFAEFYYWRGRFFAAKGWYKTARIDLEEAFFLNEKDEIAIELSKILFKLNKLEKALEVLEKVESKEAEELKIIILMKVDNRRAFSAMEHFLKKYPDNITIKFNHARMKWELFQIPDSIKELDSIINFCTKDNPIYDNALILKAEILFKLGKKENLEKLLEKIKDRSKYEQRIMNLKIKILFENKEYENIIKLAQENTFSDKEIILLIGESFKKMGKYEESYKAFLNLYEKYHSENLSELIELALKSKKYEDARKYAEINYERNSDRKNVKILLDIYSLLKYYNKILFFLDSYGKKEFLNEYNIACFKLGLFEEIKKVNGNELNIKKIRNFEKYPNILVIYKEKNEFIVRRYKIFLLLEEYILSDISDDVMIELASKNDMILMNDTEGLKPNAFSEIKTIEMRKIMSILLPHLDDYRIKIFLNISFNKDEPFSIKALRFLYSIPSQSKKFLKSSKIVPKELFIDENDDWPEFDDLFEELTNTGKFFFKKKYVSSDLPIEISENDSIYCATSFYREFSRNFPPNAILESGFSYNKDLLKALYLYCIDKKELEREFYGAIFYAILTGMAPYFCEEKIKNILLPSAIFRKNIKTTLITDISDSDYLAGISRILDEEYTIAELDISFIERSIYILSDEKSFEKKTILKKSIKEYAKFHKTLKNLLGEKENLIIKSAFFNEFKYSKLFSSISKLYDLFKELSMMISSDMIYHINTLKRCYEILGIFIEKLKKFQGRFIRISKRGDNILISIFDTFIKPILSEKLILNSDIALINLDLDALIKNRKSLSFGERLWIIDNFGLNILATLNTFYKDFEGISGETIFPEYKNMRKSYEKLLNRSFNLIGGIPFLDLSILPERTLIITNNVNFYSRQANCLNVYGLSVFILSKDIESFNREILKKAHITVVTPDFLEISKNRELLSDILFGLCIFTDTEDILYYESSFSFAYFSLLKAPFRLNIEKKIFISRRIDIYSLNEIKDCIYDNNEIDISIIKLPCIRNVFIEKENAIEPISNWYSSRKDKSEINKFDISFIPENIETWFSGIEKYFSISEIYYESSLKYHGIELFQVPTKYHLFESIYNKKGYLSPDIMRYIEYIHPEYFERKVKVLNIEHELFVILRGVWRKYIKDLSSGESNMGANPEKIIKRYFDTNRYSAGIMIIICSSDEQRHLELKKIYDELTDIFLIKFPEIIVLNADHNSESKEVNFYNGLDFESFHRYIEKRFQFMKGMIPEKGVSLKENEKSRSALSIGEFILIDKAEFLEEKEYTFIKNWADFYGNIVFFLNETKGEVFLKKIKKDFPDSSVNIIDRGINSTLI